MLIPLVLSALAFALAPDTFVRLDKLSPNVQVEMRYATENNFVGRKVAGYAENHCYLAKAAAEALAKVQADLEKEGFGIKVYDCYRPQKAVDDFVAWSKDAGDTKNKERFYPQLAKDKLFDLGYIASKSGHSRGATVDLTLVPYPYAAPKVTQGAPDCASPRRHHEETLDLGTNYDCFSELSHPSNKQVTENARKNRARLANAMKKRGFAPYEQEWWHFTFMPEPFPKTYFNFDVD